MGMMEDLPIELTDLTKQLIEGVQKRTRLPWTKGENTVWTAAVKDTLSEIAKALSPRYEAIYTTKGVSEFLVDLVWWDRQGGEGAVLALECEWYYERYGNPAKYVQEVGVDFEKLLVFKAPLKIMIFSSFKSSTDISAAVLVEIEKYLKRYKHHIPGERYLILDFAPRVRAWSTGIACAGLQRDITLKEIIVS